MFPSTSSEACYLIRMVLDVLVMSSILSRMTVGIMAADFQFGRGVFPSSESEVFKCHSFSFSPLFTSDDIHVQITQYNADNTKRYTYEAAVGWVEQITKAGFTSCSVCSGERGTQTLKFDWMAYVGTPSGTETGRFSVPMFTTGTECSTVYFKTGFRDKTPTILLTAVHTTTTRNHHDAASLWAEDIDGNHFKACIRELKNFDGTHEDLNVDWIALTDIPIGWGVPEKSKLEFANTLPPSKKMEYSYCQNKTFASSFYKAPTIITSAAHKYDSSNPLSISPQNNAITEWVEDVNQYGFYVCMKDIQAMADHHDPVTIQYLAIGHLDPCRNIKCKFYGKCKATGPSSAVCTCDYPCPAYDELVCDSRGVTFANLCEYQKEVCRMKKEPPIAHAGGCRAFTVKQGSTTMSLGTKDFQCNDIPINSSIASSTTFYTERPVHIFLTVNHGAMNGSLVHDAFTTWVEKITSTTFTACVLRAAREKAFVPPGYGSTALDWTAFQGAPRGAAVGEEIIPNWWEGTTCQTIDFRRDQFSEPPQVLVTSEHMVEDQKHDAATLWTQDITTTSFKICLRELQNFDGIHKNIHVNWLAYEDLPRNIFSEHRALYFSNSLPPAAIDNHAYCKEGLNHRIPYEKKPKVFISPSHNASHLNPAHGGSVASWLERLDKSGFKVCLKQVPISVGKHPPVTVNWVVIPECKTPLGVEKGSIPDKRFSASSQRSSYYSPASARLNKEPQPFKSAGAWCPMNDTLFEWLQVDLGHLHVVGGVATQGHNSSSVSEWVTNYQVWYSIDGEKWIVTMEHNKTKSFRGNSDRNSIVRQYVVEPFEARYVQFRPLAWFNHPCLRVEVYGCDTAPLHMFLESYSCEAAAGSCGTSAIRVDGLDLSPKKAGHNIVVMNQEGDLINRTVIDTQSDRTAAERMVAFIRDIPENNYVLIATQGKSFSYVTGAEDALRGLGAIAPLAPTTQGSWALIGFKGAKKPSTVRQAANSKTSSVIKLEIALYG